MPLPPSTFSPYLGDLFDPPASAVAAAFAVASPLPPLPSPSLPSPSLLPPSLPSPSLPSPSLTSPSRLPQSPSVASVPSLEALHPALWRAHQLGRQAVSVLGSGFAALDAELPGGGWPAGMLTELLLPHPGVGELRLLAPVLAALQQQQRSVMWFAPPACPCAWALAALGLDLRQLVLVQAQTQTLGQAVVQLQAEPQAQHQAQHQAEPQTHRSAQLSAQLARGVKKSSAADLLWALEQGLKSGHLGAVLAWLPTRLPADALRRLQLAAQAHEGPVFLLRDAAEQQRPSAAPLRLLLGSAGPDLLQVRLLKRRGPPLAQPLTLELPAVLSAPALQRAWRLPPWAATVRQASLGAAAAQTSAH